MLNGLSARARYWRAPDRAGGAGLARALAPSALAGDGTLHHAARAAADIGTRHEIVHERAGQQLLALRS
jgi:hypothetical protein